MWHMDRQRPGFTNFFFFLADVIVTTPNRYKQTFLIRCWSIIRYDVTNPTH